ncbi:MAG: hypothetical protein HQ523_02595 [Lentisphaerae bacterium]|nr:hypothetical protein [Lentisphaerota bacterium]
MNIPGFYDFKRGGPGSPQVSMLVAAIPVMPVDAGGGSLVSVGQSEMDIESLVLVYHLFLKARDPFCVIVPSTK